MTNKIFNLFFLQSLDLQNETLLMQNSFLLKIVNKISIQYQINMENEAIIPYLANSSRKERNNELPLTATNPSWFT